MITRPAIILLVILIIFSGITPPTLGSSYIRLVYNIKFNKNVAVLLGPKIAEEWCGARVNTWQQVSQGFTSASARLVVLALPREMRAEVLVYSRKQVHVTLNLSGSMLGVVSLNATYTRGNYGLDVESVEGNVSWLCRVNRSLSYDIFYAGGFLPIVKYRNYTSVNPVGLFMSSAGLSGPPQIFLLYDSNSFLSNSGSSGLEYDIVVLGEPPGREYSCCNVTFRPGETVLPADELPNGTRVAMEAAASAAEDLGVDYEERVENFGPFVVTRFIIKYPISKKGSVDIIFSNRSVYGSYSDTRRFLYHATKGFLIEGSASDLLALPLVASLLSDAFLLAYGEPYKVGMGIMTSFNSSSDLPLSIARLATVSGFHGVNISVRLADMSIPEPPRVRADTAGSVGGWLGAAGLVVSAVYVLLAFGPRWFSRMRGRG